MGGSKGIILVTRGDRLGIAECAARPGNRDGVVPAVASAPIAGRKVWMVDIDAGIDNGDNNPGTIIPLGPDIVGPQQA